MKYIHLALIVICILLTGSIVINTKRVIDNHVTTIQYQQLRLQSESNYVEYYRNMYNYQLMLHQNRDTSNFKSKANRALINQDSLIREIKKIERLNTGI